MARITETTYQESAPRVDAESGVIYGVKLLGENSKNKRKYTRKAMREAVSLYEGRKSYVNHATRENLSEDRKFQDWTGNFRNVSYREGKGIFADQHLLKSSPYFASIIEAAQNFPNSVGYSHVAEGESRHDGETEIIESIREVFSVDLVTDPATTAGFFESVDRSEGVTLREAVEALKESPERKQLIEMMDGGFLDGGFSMGEKKEQPADPMSQIAAMLQTLVAALADISKAAVNAKQPEPAIAPPASPGSEPAFPDEASGESEDEEMTEEDKQKIEAFESLARENAELKAKQLLIESGREPLPSRIKALANADEADRPELLESWDRVEISSRPARSPGLVESADSDFPRDNPEKFAALLR